MFPLLPFAVGLLTGAAAIGLFKNKDTKIQLTKAQDRLRGATVSSLNVLEHSSARLRSRLEPVASDLSPPPAVTETAVKKPARKPTTPRKSAPKTAETAVKTVKPKTGRGA